MLRNHIASIGYNNSGRLDYKDMILAGFYLFDKNLVSMMINVVLQLTKIEISNLRLLKCECTGRMGRERQELAGSCCSPCI